MTRRRFSCIRSDQLIQSGAGKRVYYGVAGVNHLDCQALMRKSLAVLRK